MHLYPESMTVVARYLLPELDEAACCLHCRKLLPTIAPVAIHRLCGIVLCGDCFGKALIDYHSSPLVGRTPPSCPSCHHYLTEENLNLTLPPLRYAVRDSLSFLTGQRWKQELERQKEQQTQTQHSYTPYGFGQVYEPVLFNAKNAVGEEFCVLPDGAAVRQNPTPQPIHYVQLQQAVQELTAHVKGTHERVAMMEQSKQGRENYRSNRGGDDGPPPYQRYDSRKQGQNDNRNQGKNHHDNRDRNHSQGNKHKGKHGRGNNRRYDNYSDSG